MSPAGPSRPGIVLASASAVRRTLLEQAGLDVVTEPARLDEAAVKEACRAERAEAADAATMLAELKAQRVARNRPGQLVIGADQMLSCGAVWFDKPPDLAHAEAQLRALRGKTHELHSAVVVVRDGMRMWRHVGRARLTMRTFYDDFLAGYLAAAGDTVLGSVGAYQLEGLGVQLFARVEGDWFDIMGLPLLPLFGFLREHGVLSA